MVYTYETSSDFFDTELSYVALNSVNILLPFDDLFFIFLQWNASSGEKILSFLSEERLEVVFYSYTVIFVFKHYKQLLLWNNCIDGSHPEDNFCFVFCTDFMFLFFWNLTAVSIFGQRLNDTMILSDADPDKHTTYETFSELLRLGDWNSRLDASPCKNVRPSLRLIVMMNLWWLKISILCFSLIFFIIFFNICNSLPCASCFSSEWVSSRKDVAFVSQTLVCLDLFCIRFHLSDIRQSHNTVRMVTYSIYTGIWSLFYILVVVLHGFC